MNDKAPITEQEREGWKIKLTDGESGGLRRAPEAIRDDEVLVMVAVEDDHFNFRYCSDRLQDNDRIARMAMEKNPDNFKFMSARLRNNKSLAKKAVAHDVHLYTECSNRLMADKDIAVIAIQSRSPGDTVDYGVRTKDIKKDIIKRFNDDPGVMKAALEQFNLARVSDCSARLQDDASFADWAMSTYDRDESASHFSEFSARLRDDPIMAGYAVRQRRENLEACSARLLDDEHFVLSVLPHIGGDSFYRISDRLRGDEPTVLKMMEVNPNILHYCHAFDKDPLMAALAGMIKAEDEERTYDPSALPPQLRGAYDAAMMVHGKNDADLRVTFFHTARGTYAHNLTMPSAQQGQQQPLPRQVTPDDVLADVDVFDFSPSR